MNYELAKKLKDAGFPQVYAHLPNSKGGYTQYHTMDVVWNDGLVQRIRFFSGYWEARDGDKWTQEELEADSVAKVPTLSELIEVCGGQDNEWNFTLGYIGGATGQRWNANFWRANETTYQKMWMFPKFNVVSGSTPEEAVANLWLALNEKHGTNE